MICKFWSKNLQSHPYPEWYDGQYFTIDSKHKFQYFQPINKNVPSLAFEHSVKCIVPDLNPGLKWHEFWTIYVNFTWYGVGKINRNFLFFIFWLKDQLYVQCGVKQKIQYGFWIFSKGMSIIIFENAFAWPLCIRVRLK